ncbi:hypothetical protein QCD60_10295 [Pokkaliibacter sp. MBI-7]|uniref:hypothetical protein n=1 Tax=Pokkaliibacter sp. MBI-7 TaxID=3040600 RepID=UPI00244AE457|nr:hypothetical protein [Pokkaliibacter sp. MBI-7]MDH2432956.1 hypothetical protein [Pokkaliibacter sp. MBI-7]
MSMELATIYTSIKIAILKFLGRKWLTLFTILTPIVSVLSGIAYKGALWFFMFGRLTSFSVIPEFFHIGNPSSYMLIIFTTAIGDLLKSVIAFILSCSIGSVLVAPFCFVLYIIFRWVLYVAKVKYKKSLRKKTGSLAIRIAKKNKKSKKTKGMRLTAHQRQQEESLSAFVKKVFNISLAVISATWLGLVVILVVLGGGLYFFHKGAEFGDKQLKDFNDHNICLDDLNHNGCYTLTQSDLDSGSVSGFLINLSETEWVLGLSNELCNCSLSECGQRHALLPKHHLKTL